MPFSDESHGRNSVSGRGRGGKARAGGRSSVGGRGGGSQRGGSRANKTKALNRPRYAGALKHTPDPERIKSLYSPVSKVVIIDIILTLLSIN